MPVVIGGDNLPSPVRIGLTDLQNIGGTSGPPGPPPGSGITVINLTRVCTVFLFRFLPWLHISSLGEGKRREAVGDRDKAKDNQAAVMLMKDSHFKYLLTLTRAFLIRILIACHTYYPCSSIGPFF